MTPPRRSLLALAASLAGLALAACSGTTTTPSSESGDPPAGGSGGATAGAAGAPGTAESGECPKGLPGPSLVKLQTPAGVSYCMDRTEVTQGQYALFMKELDGKAENAAPLATQDPICKFGFELLTRGVEPTEDSPGECAPSLYDPEKKSDVPVVCVHHCAARLYCAWAGKELCGRPGGGRGTATGNETAEDKPDVEESAWSNACTSGGTLKSVSPGGVASGACSIVGPYGAGAKAVDADAECHAPNPPFDAVRGLGGGVLEWEDLCVGGECSVRGARPRPPGEPVSDDCADRLLMGGPSDIVGFRCCKPL